MNLLNELLKNDIKEDVDKIYVLDIEDNTEAIVTENIVALEEGILEKSFYKLNMGNLENLGFFVKMVLQKMSNVPDDTDEEKEA